MCVCYYAGLKQEVLFINPVSLIVIIPRSVTLQCLHITQTVLFVYPVTTLKSYSPTGLSNEGNYDF